jgi:hypothetical protein
MAEESEYRAGARVRMRDCGHEGTVIGQTPDGRWVIRWDLASVFHR